MQHWSKSVLSIYRYLETLTRAIDGLVKKNSNLSFNYGHNTTYTLASKILKWTEKKRKMINLKVVTAEALVSMPSIYKRILVLYYVDGVKSSVIAELLGVSIRTYYRKKKAALDKFGLAMAKQGFDLDYLNKNYSSEKWLMSVYDACLEKDSATEETLVIHENKTIIKNIINDLKHIKATPLTLYA